MTSLELAKSIIDYNCKKNFALYMKPTNSDLIKEEGEKIYSSVENFINYHKSNDSGKVSFYLSAKQASFLQSLMRNEKIQAIDLGGLFAYVAHPKIPFSAYGGFVGKKDDQSRFILKISRTKSDCYYK